MFGSAVVAEQLAAAPARNSVQAQMWKRKIEFGKGARVQPAVVSVLAKERELHCTGAAAVAGIVALHDAGVGHRGGGTYSDDERVIGAGGKLQGGDVFKPDHHAKGHCRDSLGGTALHGERRGPNRRRLVEEYDAVVGEDGDDPAPLPLLSGRGRGRIGW